MTERDGEKLLPDRAVVCRRRWCEVRFFSAPRRRSVKPAACWRQDSETHDARQPPKPQSVVFARAIAPVSSGRCRRAGLVQSGARQGAGERDRIDVQSDAAQLAHEFIVESVPLQPLLKQGSKIVEHGVIRAPGAWSSA